MSTEVRNTFVCDDQFMYRCTTLHLAGHTHTKWCGSHALSPGGGGRSLVMGTSGMTDTMSLCCDIAQIRR